MSRDGNRLVAIFLASILAFAVRTDAQARHHRFVGGVGHHHFGGLAGRRGMGAAALDAGHFAQDHIAHNNFRGGFGYGYGWYGPVFWPHAFDDVFNDILWGYGLGGPFWDYGYGDIYAGLFTPLGSSDLAGAPTGEQARDTVPPPIGGSAESRQANPSSEFSQMCGDGSREIASWPIDRIERSAFPTAEQRTGLDEFADATIQAAQTIKDACPIEIVLTPTRRLEAMQKRIEGMAQAVAIVARPFERLYSSLTDEQKARLDTANEQNRRNRGSAESCNLASSATRWPADQIEKAVRPDRAQQTKLDALKMAMVAAADDLKDTCPSSLPASPRVHLRAITRRLDAMLKAVENVRAVFDDFYSTLSDEQKAQFNEIGGQRSARE
jgi:LTXXQ motif family protein